MQRTCFLLKVKPDMLEQYKTAHANVWPDMQAALKDAGWSNYSLFLREDGLVVGYVETEDFEAARAKLGETKINARWQKEMAPYFEELGDQRADQGLKLLPGIFYLP